MADVRGLVRIDIGVLHDAFGSVRTGACGANTAKPDGAACDDGNACTGSASSPKEDCLGCSTPASI